MLQQQLDANTETCKESRGFSGGRREMNSEQESKAARSMSWMRRWGQSSVAERTLEGELLPRGVL